ncbi:hypothetical protein G166_gp19 [Clostridium phage phi8074-B1]|uniref:hypothetical protein n=1 Tax=Clostridium phage phi8074-B1 TaxID=1147137 RepID=UPI00025C0C46|nr:hypothetical protein G166_gp19 [Clostridium phage phi8074-B1]AFC61951.1 putative phage protein [Clostridium phage phi8074-B1]
MTNLQWWTIAYQQGWVTAEQLKGAVKHEMNVFGEITPEQYEEITGIKFEV